MLTKFHIVRVGLGALKELPTPIAVLQLSFRRKPPEGKRRLLTEVPTHAENFGTLNPMPCK